MSVYPLNPYKKGGSTLYPHNSSYTEEYALRTCEWFLTDHLYKDEHGNVHCNYRLHSNKPRNFSDFMAYDIICPRCHQRMHPIQNAISYRDLALYACRNCEKK